MESKQDGLYMVENEILIYQTEDGQTKIDVKIQDETVWLTQAQLCELYQTSKSNISEHIKHIFEEGELEEAAVVRKFRTTAADEKNYNTSIVLLSHKSPDSVINTAVEFGEDDDRISLDATLNEEKKLEKRKP